nr:recombinase family protein [Rubrobacteraceae bacterium]
ADFDRPGMDRVRDLVAAGGVDVVMANRWDRLGRASAIEYILEPEFAEHGTTLEALDVPTGDTPANRLHRRTMSSFAEYEREVIADRMRRGRLNKARDGRLIPYTWPHYGFRFVTRYVGNRRERYYEVDPEQMAVVRRIHEMIALEGRSLHGVADELERLDIRTARGGKRWDMRVVKTCITEDVYRPHTREELERFVQAGQMRREVADRLEPGERVGISWYGRRKVSTYKVREGGEIKKRTKSTPRPESDHIAVPAPDSGLDPELIDAARAVVAGNQRTVKVHDRTWELGGGIMFCGTCGRRMATHTPSYKRKSGATVWRFYYRCPEGVRWNYECPNRKNRRAEKVEAEVWDFVVGLLTRPETVLAGLDELIEQEWARLRRAPLGEERALADRLALLDRRRDGFLELAADGYYDRTQLDAKLKEVDGIRATVERELETVRTRGERLTELRRARDEWGGGELMWFRHMAGGDPRGATPEERVRVYRRLRLRVEAHEDGSLTASGVFGEGVEIVCGGNRDSLCFPYKRRGCAP